MTTNPRPLAQTLEECFRREWPGLVAAAARITGDLGTAEEVVQDALTSALARWPFSGVPDRPGAWLLTASRNRARNLVRDRAREQARWEAAAERSPADDDHAPAPIGDDRLRLVFVCCHPVLAPEAQVALAMRLIGGLSTRQIARAFLQTDTAVAQRLVRAKRTLAEAGVPFAVPEPAEWPARLPGVLNVAYLIFNEGYLASEGPDLDRPDLCREALRLVALLAELIDDQAEVFGLLALINFHLSREATRRDADGDLVLLADQERWRWDAGHLAAAHAALNRALALGVADPYTLQASIAACHADAPTWEQTAWPRIVELYDQLIALTHSPVVELNRAVAVAMASGPPAGLEALNPIVAAGQLDGYHLLWATRADLLRRAGRLNEAASDYRRALTLATNAAEQRFLAARIDECEPPRRTASSP
jgi:RNA polymerase sigma-70 factor (ECF subfamily)